MSRGAGWVAVALLASAVVRGAQDQRPTFRSTANGVLVNAFVLSSRLTPGRSVDGLTGADFEVLDNGARQTATAEPARGPIDLTLVIDLSDSEASVAVATRKFVQRLLTRLEPTDRIRVLVCRGVVHEAVPLEPVQATLDLSELDRPGGYYDRSLIEGLFDAMVLEADPDRRQVVLAIGRLTGREMVGPSALGSIASGTDATVYIVAHPALVASPPTLQALMQVVSTTGGALFLSPVIGPAAPPLRLAPMAPATSGGAVVIRGDLKDVETIVVNDLHHGYVLSYTPAGGTTPGWHNLQVRVVGPKSQAYVVRARKRYYAGSQ